MMTCGRFHVAGTVGVVLALLACSPAFAQGEYLLTLLTEIDRLAWLRVWTRAEPLYAEAREAFARSGDRRNTLYAEINRLRGQLPTLPVPESPTSHAYLDDPIVQNDGQLRLRADHQKRDRRGPGRVAVATSATAPLALAQKLGEAGWANRARGELGLVAFLQGDTNTCPPQKFTTAVRSGSCGDPLETILVMKAAENGVGENAMAFGDPMAIRRWCAPLVATDREYLARGSRADVRGYSVEPTVEGPVADDAHSRESSSQGTHAGSCRSRVRRTRSPAVTERES